MSRTRSQHASLSSRERFSGFGSMAGEPDRRTKTGTFAWLAYLLLICGYAVWVATNPAPLAARDIWVNQFLETVAVVFLFTRAVTETQDRAGFSLLGSGLLVWQATDFFLCARVRYGNRSNS